MPHAQWTGGEGTKRMVRTRENTESVQELVLRQESQLGTH